MVLAMMLAMVLAMVLAMPMLTATEQMQRLTATEQMQRLPATEQMQRVSPSLMLRRCGPFVPMAFPLLPPPCLLYHGVLVARGVPPYTHRTVLPRVFSWQVCSSIHLPYSIKNGVQAGEVVRNNVQLARADPMNGYRADIIMLANGTVLTTMLSKSWSRGSPAASCPTTRTSSSLRTSAWRRPCPSPTSQRSGSRVRSS